MGQDSNNKYSEYICDKKTKADFIKDSSDTIMSSDKQ